MPVWPMAMPSQMPGYAEEERPPAAGVHTLLDEPLQIAHADVPGDQVGEARGNTDHGLCKLVPGYARGE